jgi:hypothetical protein
MENVGMSFCHWVYFPLFGMFIKKNLATVDGFHKRLKM